MHQLELLITFLGLNNLVLLIEKVFEKGFKPPELLVHLRRIWTDALQPCVILLPWWQVLGDGYSSMI